MQTKRNLNAKTIVTDILVTSLGIAIAAVGIEGFLVPNGFFDGGVTGISMFSAELTGIPLGWLILAINTPFILVGWRMLGVQVALSALVAIGMLSTVLLTVHIGELTNDKLLAAAFGGLCLGIGLGLVLRRGIALDGTEIVAIMISRRTGFSIGDVILGFNLIIFSVISSQFGLERAMYSVLAYVVASKSINFVITGIEEYTAVTIISGQSDDIRQAIIHDMGRAVTIYQGRRGMGGEPQDILFTVVSRMELNKVKRLSRGIDNKAFIVMHKINDTEGGMIRRKLSSKNFSSPWNNKGKAEATADGLARTEDPRAPQAGAEGQSASTSDAESPAPPSPSDAPS